MRKHRLKDFIDPNWFPMLIEDLSDREFIALSKQQESLNEKDQIRFVFNNSSHNLDPLFSPMTREIDGKQYSFGLKVMDPFTAAEVANTAIDALREIYYERKEIGLQEKIIENKSSESVIRGIINREIKKINSKRDYDESIKSFYTNGYNCREGRDEYFEFIKAKNAFSFPNDYINQAVIISHAEGAADYDLEEYCKQLLKMLGQGKQLPFLYKLYEDGPLSLGGRGGTDSFPNRKILELNPIKAAKTVTKKKNNSKPERGRPRSRNISEKLSDFFTEPTWKLFKDELIEYYFIEENEGGIRWIEDCEGYFLYRIKDLLKPTSSLKGKNYNMKEAFRIFKNTFPDYPAKEPTKKFQMIQYKNLDKRVKKDDKKVNKSSNKAILNHREIKLKIDSLIPFFHEFKK